MKNSNKHCKLPLIRNSFMEKTFLNKEKPVLDYLNFIKCLRM